jgi:hypothetical protein
MAAGLTPTTLDLADLVAMVDARELAMLSAKRRAMLVSPQSN